MADNPNMPVGSAAVSWVDGSGNVNLQVFSTDGYTVTNQVWNGGWQAGNFSQPGSQVSATAYVSGGTPSIRVYCTATDQTTEYCQDGGGDWYVGGYSQG